MKNIIIFLGLTITTFSISAVNIVEIDETKEIQCHSELKAMSCAEKKNTQLTK